MPSPRLLGATEPRSLPSSRIAPLSTGTKPAIICSVVVLPQPEGPSRETNSPRSTERFDGVNGGEAAEALGQAIEDEM